VTALTDSLVEFGLIPKEDWVQPSWIDEANATVARKQMEKNNVIYGGEMLILLQKL
jgi:alpha 1,2-mannosyltransferase